MLVGVNKLGARRAATTVLGKSSRSYFSYLMKSSLIHAYICTRKAPNQRRKKCGHLLKKKWIFERSICNDKERIIKAIWLHYVPLAELRKGMSRLIFRDPNGFLLGSDAFAVEYSHQGSVQVRKL